MIRNRKNRLSRNSYKKTGAPSCEKDELLKVLIAADTVKPDDLQEEDFYEADDEEYEDLETEAELELQLESEIASEI